MKKIQSLNPFFQTQQPKLGTVFPDYTDFDVIRTWQEKGCLPPIHEIDEETDSSSAWLAYALHHAYTKYPKANVYDKNAFAGIIQGVYSGLFGGFGTDDERQEKIEKRTLFVSHRLSEAKASDHAKAKILLIFLEDQYFNKPNPNTPNK